MSGYFASPRDTAAIFFDDPAGRRWLRTGDIVTVDPDGFFRVVDRKKDMINRAGFKVYPAKCEHILAMHPQVVEAAVVGIAASSNGDEPESTSSDADAHDNTRGEQVVAVIVARSHDINRTTLMTELQALCREHLAVYEVPTRFVFLDQLPKSVLGKVLKKDLRVTLASTPVSHAESPVPHNGDSKAAPVGRPTSSVPISPIPRGPAVAR
jgi:long-chain acyl-CoA synthetase